MNPEETWGMTSTPFQNTPTHVLPSLSTSASFTLEVATSYSYVRMWLCRVLPVRSSYSCSPFPSVAIRMRPPGAAVTDANTKSRLSGDTLTKRCSSSE